VIPRARLSPEALVGNTFVFLSAAADVISAKEQKSLGSDENWMEVNKSGPVKKCLLYWEAGTLPQHEKAVSTRERGSKAPPT
jgi:hypothetical protein